MFQYRKRYVLLQQSDIINALNPDVITFQYRKRYVLLQPALVAEDGHRFIGFNTVNGMCCCNMECVQYSEITLVEFQYRKRYVLLQRMGNNKLICFLIHLVSIP